MRLWRAIITYQIRFIEYMPFTSNRQYYFSAEDMKKLLLEAGFRLGLAEERGSCLAEIYNLPGSKGSIGFITPVSRHFCQSCSRLRLTPDVLLSPVCCRIRNILCERDCVPAFQMKNCQR